jgi:hypothetical protein
MSRFSYVEALSTFRKQLRDNVRLIKKKNEIDEKPGACDPRWPEDLRAFYSEMNGATIHYLHLKRKNEPRVSGHVKLLPAAQAASGGEGLVWFSHTPAGSPLRRFKLVDFFVDEAAVGFYEGGDGEMHLYEFAGDPTPLGVRFEGYVRLLCEARGYFYWQKALVALKGGPASQEADDFREAAPELFPDFQWARFTDLFESVRI